MIRPHPHTRRTGLRWRWLLLLWVIPLLCSGVYLTFPPAPVDILVLGVDSRPGDGWMARADSVLLVGINPARWQTALLSIPRDLSVEVPGYGLQRINTVNMLGEMENPGDGPRLMREALLTSAGVQIERYVRLDFNGFVRLIDAVGGITIDVERRIVDYAYPTIDHGIMTVEFEAGPQHMDGERALIYARTRHADDDYRRAERQQQVISALVSRLINPFYWPAVVGVLHQSIDTDMTLWDWIVLAPPLVVSGPRAERLVIDRQYITATAGGAAIPNYAAIAPWLELYFD